MFLSTPNPRFIFPYLFSPTSQETISTRGMTTGKGGGGPVQTPPLPTSPPPPAVDKVIAHTKGDKGGVTNHNYTNHNHSNRRPLCYRWYHRWEGWYHSRCRCIYLPPPTPSRHKVSNHHHPHRSIRLLSPFTNIVITINTTVTTNSTNNTTTTH